jgi:hypothetical protein
MNIRRRHRQIGLLSGGPLRILSIALLASGLFPAAHADCVSDAAAFHSVNDGVLRAILWNESHMNAGAVNRNSNGSIDVGIGQMNSQHFDELRRLGVTPQMLMEPCVGTYVAAWHLSKQVKALGNTWQAVGSYHSRTPLLNQGYANGVAATMKKWGLLADSFWPFPGAPKSDAEAQRILYGRPPQASTAPRPRAGGKGPSPPITIEGTNSIIALTQ